MAFALRYAIAKVRKRHDVATGLPVGFEQCQIAFHSVLTSSDRDLSECFAMSRSCCVFIDRQPLACGVVLQLTETSLPNLPISETVDKVIVHHANRLHVRINDGRPYEAESPTLEILAERIGF